MLELKDDVLRLRLVAQSDNQPVRISAMSAVPESPVGTAGSGQSDELRWTTSSSTPCPIAKARAAVRTLDLRGAIAASVRTLAGRHGRKPFHQHSIWACSAAAIRYENFPYAVSAISAARWSMDDGMWPSSN